MKILLSFNTNSLDIIVCCNEQQEDRKVLQQADGGLDIFTDHVVGGVRIISAEHLVLFVCMCVREISAVKALQSKEINK